MVASPRSTNTRGFPLAPTHWADTEEGLRKQAEVINSLREGKVNSVNTVTLTANSATTTLSDVRIGPNSAILLMPTTANAAVVNQTLYIAPGNQTATITHANNAQTDRTFVYAIFG